MNSLPPTNQLWIPFLLSAFSPFMTRSLCPCEV
jgi:hypothetical protein